MQEIVEAGLPGQRAFRLFRIVERGAQNALGLVAHVCARSLVEGQRAPLDHRSGHLHVSGSQTTETRSAPPVEPTRRILQDPAWRGAGSGLRLALLALVVGGLLLLARLVVQRRVARGGGSWGDAEGHGGIERSRQERAGAGERRDARPRLLGLRRPTRRAARVALGDVRVGASGDEFRAALLRLFLDLLAKLRVFADLGRGEAAQIVAVILLGGGLLGVLDLVLAARVLLLLDLALLRLLALVLLALLLLALRHGQPPWRSSSVRGSTAVTDLPLGSTGSGSVSPWGTFGPRALGLLASASES